MNKRIYRTIGIIAVVIILLTILIVIFARAGEVTLAWDANTEENLAGYKILVGQISRTTGAAKLVEDWCAENDIHTNDDQILSGPQCVAWWLTFCDDQKDQACHAYLFSYEREVDVGNVTEYVLTGIEKEKTYYLAAVAYDDENNESAYSIELSYIDYAAPMKPKKINGRPYMHLAIPIQLEKTDTLSEVIIDHQQYFLSIEDQNAKPRQ